MDDTTHNEEAWSIVLAPTQDGWKVRCLCHGSRLVEDGAHIPTVGAHGSGPGPVADRGLPHTPSLHDRWHHVSRGANPRMSLSPRPVAWSELSRSPPSALHVESGTLGRSLGGRERVCTPGGQTRPAMLRMGHRDSNTPLLSLHRRSHHPLAASDHQPGHLLSNYFASSAVCKECS